MHVNLISVKFDKIYIIFHSLVVVPLCRRRNFANYQFLTCWQKNKLSFSAAGEVVAGAAAAELKLTGNLSKVLRCQMGFYFTRIMFNIY